MDVARGTDNKRGRSRNQKKSKTEKKGKKEKTKSSKINRKNIEYEPSPENNRNSIRSPALGPQSPNENLGGKMLFTTKN